MYFEDKKILNVEDAARIGFKRLHVSYELAAKEDGAEPEVVEEKFDVPEWELTAVSSETKKDASYGRYMRELYVTQRLYNVLREMDVYVDEISVYIRRLLETCEVTENKAVAHYMGLENRREARIEHWHPQEEVASEEPKV